MAHSDDHLVCEIRYLYFTLYLCQALAIPRLSEAIYSYSFIYVNTVNILISDNLYLWIIPRQLPNLPQNLQVNKNTVKHQGLYTFPKAYSCYCNKHIRFLN